MVNGICHTKTATVATTIGYQTQENIPRTLFNGIPGGRKQIRKLIDSHEHMQIPWFFPTLPHPRSGTQPLGSFGHSPTYSGPGGKHEI